MSEIFENKNMIEQYEDIIHEIDNFELNLIELERLHNTDKTKSRPYLALVIIIYNRIIELIDTSKLDSTSKKEVLKYLSDIIKKYTQSNNHKRLN